MGLFKMLGRAVGGIMGLFGFGRRQSVPAGVAVLSEHDALADRVIARAEPQRSIVAPAVAGFQMRLHVDCFLFARRLASVAKLNTPVGRKPRTAAIQPAGTPPLPASRIGAKKRRTGGNHGPRVLKQAPPQARPSATILPFPALRASQAGRSKPLRRAA